MSFKSTFTILLFLALCSCADYSSTKIKKSKEKILLSSKGFALIYKDEFYKDGSVNRKLDTENFAAMHSFLKKNTLIKIINPINSKVIELKVHKKANYPKIFNIVISDKVASFLDLDINNPYVEILELKKNKKFIAKESNTFEEEKNVADKAPVGQIKMNDLSEKNNKNFVSSKKRNFFLIISNFYYLESANNLKSDLIKKTSINKFLVKKINNNKYRLSVGPFENFKALKLAYISLNNLGFENLNVYNE